MDIAIRRARGDEAEALTRVAHAAKRYWGYPEAYIQLWKDDLTVTPDFVERQAVFCAVQDAKILGFYALSGEGKTYELEHLWVEPEYIGTGIGAQLLAHAARTIRAAGGTTLRIASDPHAEGFYRRMGARRVGEVASKPEGRTLPLLVLELR